MPISQLGQVNVSALKVPQTLVQIVPPQFLFNGVSSNINGYVGTASWGPVNLAQSFGSYAQYASIFGPTINRLYDIGAHVILADAQGAGYYVAVRVTDGTDVAASVAVAATGAVQASATDTFGSQPSNGNTLTINGTAWTFVNTITTGNQIQIGGTLAQTIANAAATLSASADSNTSLMTYSASPTVLTITAKVFGTAGNAYTVSTNVSGATLSGATLSGGVNGSTGVTVTGKYTGSLGNFVKFNIQKGTANSSYKIIISGPNLATEIFDNVGAGLSGNAVWVAIANAVNNGTSGTRPPSKILVASAGSATAAPILGVYSLSGGSDGAGSITTSILLGQDALPRTGMYALRGTNAAQFTLCDCSDLSSFSTQLALGLQIGAYVVTATAMSDTITSAVSELPLYGIDSFGIKVLFGDWIVWIDTTNGIPQRVTSPAAVSMGLLGALSPQMNTLNKPINGIVGTQSSILGVTYSYSDFQQLAGARMDIITIDTTVSNNFIHRLGINTSSNEITFGDEYTKVIYWLSKSLNIIGNQYLGANMTPTEQLQAKVAIQNFLQLAQTNGIIYTFDGSQAYQVVLDSTNNTQQTAALGYQYAYVKAVIGPIVRYFIINLEGGSSVVISDTPPGTPVTTAS